MVPGRGGKGRGERGDSIPVLTSGWGGLWRAARSSGRRWQVAALVVVLRRRGEGLEVASELVVVKGSTRADL